MLVALSTGHRRELNKFTPNTDTDHFFFLFSLSVCRVWSSSETTKRPSKVVSHAHPMVSITEKCENKRQKYFMACQRFEFDEHYAFSYKWIRNLCFGDKNNRRKYVFVHSEFPESCSMRQWWVGAGRAAQLGAGNNNIKLRKKNAYTKYENFIFKCLFGVFKLFFSFLAESHFPNPFTCFPPVTMQKNRKCWLPSNQCHQSHVVVWQLENERECVYSNNPTDVVIFTKSKHISNGMQFQNNIHFMIISASEERRKSDVENGFDKSRVHCSCVSSVHCIYMVKDLL